MSSRGGACFPKRARLRKRPEFINLSRWGRKIHTPHFVILTKPNDRGETRLGLTVSSKVGNAVVRNRVKRLVRECFRQQRGHLRPPQDVVVIARFNAGELSFAQARDELQKFLTMDKSPRNCG